ncbi:MAG: S46 family peptidase [Archangium gephyra]|uniref:Dipeptidyl-peptidase n=1 Tax=Archangium gephyra TaxID=48 RepID=A0A2W5V821_9BACT|nr:MAG: S46 family peptidase [Archangium gephyra]
MRILCALVTFASSVALAEEGMWLFNDFPSAQVKKDVGVTVDQAWLDRVRLGSLRLANGCSASLVSPDGLVMTNHHCIRACLEDLSTPSRDLLATGFLGPEEKCPKFEGNQLVKITNVTDSVREATRGASGPEFQKKLKAETSRLESECTKGDATKRCDVVTLFHGAQFHLYEYRRYQDLRLVFAPEFQMAAFGGDPDNFNFPRYGFDAAFLRVYVDGKPAKTPEHLKWARKPAKENDVVFVSGHPGGTERSLTVAQYEYLRDVSLPWLIAAYAESRGRLDEWARQSPERERVSKSRLRAIENSLKALKGRREALVEPSFLANKRTAEMALREKAPEATKGAWDAIAGAMLTQRGLYVDFMMREGGFAFQSELFAHARKLARFPVETSKPNGERLREYTDAQLPALKQSLLDPAPIPLELEKARLTWSLTRLREVYGADDAFVKKVLAGKSPDDRAAELIDGTKLADPEVRKQRLEATGKLEEADPMMAFAKLVDGEARAVRKRFEEEVDAVVKKNGELLAEARRTVGVSGAPDATFTLRLTYGRIKGVEKGPAMTTVKGLFERATGKAPYAVTEKWTAARARLNPATPYNVATTNDIIGGNSGSPLVNANGEVVGLVFDGNLQSLGGNFGYEPVGNRAVAVHGDLIITALRQVYGATNVANELTR